MIVKNNFQLLFFSFIIGFLLMVFFLGYDNISITDTNWFLKYDTLSDFLALKFFLNDKWHFPIGLNPNYGDITNSIVFSGAVPLLSFIAKIFKNFLPNNFHFFSIWITICFSLHIFFSYKIIFNHTKNFSFSLISVIFFIFTPILIYRLGIHLSLGAHWLILAAIYLELSNNRKNILLYKIILIIISSLIHFYFTIMLLLMNSFFSFFNYLKTKNFNILLKDNIFVLIPLLITMYVVGYFTIPVSDTLGYGHGFYKANILTFFDPATSDQNSWSIFLPNITTVKGEYEGFGYLGLGVLFLNILLIFYIFKNFIYNLKTHLKYILLSIIFLLLAFTQSMHIGTFEVTNIELPKILYAPLSIIRASGRFIWPVYYLLIIFSLIAFYKLKIKYRYLIFFSILQLVDLNQGIQNNFNKEIKKNNLDKIIWSDISKDFNNVITTYPSDTSDIFTEASSLLIERKFDKTNIFRLGRYNREEISKLRSKLYLKFFEKKIDEKTIYFIENIDHLRHLKFLLKENNIGFFKRNGIWLILPSKKLKMNESDVNRLSLVNVKKINLKEKLNISFKDPNGILGLGWSHTRDIKNYGKSGAWSEGYKSSLIFDLSNLKKLNQVILTISEVSIIDKKPLLVKFYLNNNKLKTLKLKNLKDQKVIIDLPENILNEQINFIDFEIENPSTPLSKLESVDARLLGILIKDIVFQ